MTEPNGTEQRVELDPTENLGSASLHPGIRRRRLAEIMGEIGCAMDEEPTEAQNDIARDALLLLADAIRHGEPDQEHLDRAEQLLNRMLAHPSNAHANRADAAQREKDGTTKRA